MTGSVGQSKIRTLNRRRVASLLALAPGSHLGGYEVTALIGKRQNGTSVSRDRHQAETPGLAQDLPPSVAADQDRLARFQHEGIYPQRRREE
jgi:hypothetical protein